jgi:hypothetical protein
MTPLIKQRPSFANNIGAAPSHDKSRSYALILGILTLLFAARVAGQLVTLFFPVKFLPPFDRWYSGIIPYPILLPIQLLLLTLMLKIVWDVYRGAGYFTVLKPQTGRILKVLSYGYALIMVGRYAVTMTLHPELRWFTGTTPIWFHFVLASFLFMLGNFYSSHVAGRRPHTQR